jgi:hypothetical protein
MNNFAEWLTPKQAFDKHNHIPPISLAEFEAMAKNNGPCMNCGEHVWRYGDCGLCFTCTTGEADASDDFEVGEPYY